jgi:hypothetical protein
MFPSILKTHNRRDLPILKGNTRMPLCVPQLEARLHQGLQPNSHQKRLYDKTNGSLSVRLNDEDSWFERMLQKIKQSQTCNNMRKTAGNKTSQNTVLLITK